MDRVRYALFQYFFQCAIYSTGSAGIGVPVLNIPLVGYTFPVQHSNS
jgi:hypothetical protein